MVFSKMVDKIAFVCRCEGWMFFPARLPCLHLTPWPGRQDRQAQVAG
jgi:hypothetical protein